MLHYGCEDVEVAKEDFYTKGYIFKKEKFIGLSSEVLISQVQR